MLKTNQPVVVKKTYKWVISKGRAGYRTRSGPDRQQSAVKRVYVYECKRFTASQEDGVPSWRVCVCVCAHEKEVITFAVCAPVWCVSGLCQPSKIAMDRNVFQWPIYFRTLPFWTSDIFLEYILQSMYSKYVKYVVECVIEHVTICIEYVCRCLWHVKCSLSGWLWMIYP